MREEILKKAVEYIIDLRKNLVGIPVNAKKTEHEQLESSIVLTMNPLQKDRQEEISAPPSMDYFVNIAPPPLNRSNNNLNDEQESSIHSDNSRKVEVLDNNEGRQEESVELNKNITQIQIETESCMICFEDVPKIEFETLLKCSHSFCKKCYIEHIKELMNNNKVIQWFSRFD